MQSLENTNTSSRVKFIDIAKGIGIILVVSYHQNGIFGYYLNLFFMPLFFLMSGIFFKANREPKEFLTKTYRHLWLPFIIGLVLGAILEVFVYDFENARESIESGFYNFYLVGNVPLWFLVSLSWLMLCTYLVERNVRSEKTRLLIYASLSVVGYLLSMAELRNTLFIGQALLTYPFFILGFKTKSYWLSLRWYDWRIGLLALVALLGILIFLNPYTNVHRLELSPYYFDSMIVALCFIILIFIVSQMSVGSHIARFLGWIGRSTIDILILHYLLIAPADYILAQCINLDNYRWAVMFVVLFAESVLLCVVSVAIGKAARGLSEYLSPMPQKALE